MAKEIVLVKVPQGFTYATDADKEIAKPWNLGQAVKVPVKIQSARSLQYHKRYWGGLLALTLEYWEPDKGMTTEAEQRLIHSCMQWLDKMSGGGYDMQKYGEEFLNQLSQNRAAKYETTEKSIEDLHEWVKEKAGYYYVVNTPSGPRRKTMSINFNAMSQEQFKEYYKKAFNICWRYVLSSNFTSKDCANRAAERLLMLE